MEEHEHHHHDHHHHDHDDLCVPEPPPPIPDPPPAELIEMVRAYYVAQRAELLQRVADLEVFLGFIVTNQDLAIRIARLEAFTRIPLG